MLEGFLTSLWLWWTIVCPEENRIEKLFRTTSPGELLKELIKSQNNNKKNKKHAPKTQPGGDGVGSGGKKSQCPPMFLKVFIEDKLGLFHVTFVVRTRSRMCFRLRLDNHLLELTLDDLSRLCQHHVFASENVRWIKHFRTFFQNSKIFLLCLQPDLVLC